MKSSEIWKPVKGYKGLYEVSNLGRVRSLDRLRPYKTSIFGDKFSSISRGKLLATKLAKTGYLEVSLCCNNILKSYRIHRLVAEAFIHNPNNYPCINHKNEIKTDNRVENLEWCTVKYNTEEYYKSRTCIYQYDLEGNLIRIWNSITKAAEHYNIDKTGIQHCCAKKLKTYYNFIWTYSPLNNIDYEYRKSNFNKFKVALFDFNENLIKKFNSMTEAAKYAKCNPSFISMCCTGIRKSKVGIWKKLKA